MSYFICGDTRHHAAPLKATSLVCEIIVHLFHMGVICCISLAHELLRSHKHDMCVSVLHCNSHAYKACRRALSSHLSAVHVPASSFTRMLMNSCSNWVCATQSPVMGVRLPMISFLLEQFLVGGHRVRGHDGLQPRWKYRWCSEGVCSVQHVLYRYHCQRSVRSVCSVFLSPYILWFICLQTSGGIFVSKRLVVYLSPYILWYIYITTSLCRYYR